MVGVMVLNRIYGERESVHVEGWSYLVCEYPLTKCEGGLQSLFHAEDDTVNWLETMTKVLTKRNE